MKHFKLPDLGEGLPEAEIVEWHVKVGDTVSVDQVLVSVETAKAIVEVPSPEAGTIAKLYGEPGDIIHTGEPLVAFEGEGGDRGTVVGELKSGEPSAGGPSADTFIIGAAASSRRARANRATPGVRALAERLGVSLEQIKGSGPGGLITNDDVHRHASHQKQLVDAEPLRGTRRTMAKNMALSHAQVVPVSIFEDADISDWPPGTDITMRLVQAIGVACEVSPALNCWFDGDNLSRRLLREVHVGIAVDTPEGLFVPVLRDITHRSLKDLRQGLENLREAVATRTIPPGEMQGATITLSNFGTLAGQYANPVVTPPQVAIVGAGRIRDKVLPVNGEPAVRRVLPLSLTFDHRAATGGEAARFLGAMVQFLRET
ncbi:dihydrolipoamide acetyltransferase family protein [Marinobacter lutaoensis]|jgi:pyruvate dehydrogenase E2 component (dihydrolipoamide acetyltransferase)|uniref:Dihydrolipoamide acetyltransferase component of pyruvate dehydrogenase complex n=1 Tax=Marinobacter lutaoensis TaxID=135739 RepID=A0A1V2DQH4_9GAMM|nr:dihydrolipoamide acetyltransferase family protein [Marinobacter lutaoensis]MBI42950.1 2-oxo acid dehydrogenase subunit E2 [Oceanospirillales bacterium]NVD34565.1 2-oxo acid dehydrogenase subunit E2 [Marinobacter lutaoensis]ONF42898.1 branched-chain alpha-keto acid dehydrogenase subunit E2 [Marinobacter lutaoensis]